MTEDGEFDDDYEKDFEDYEDADDEIGAEGNRVVGARSQAVVEHVARSVVDEPDAVEVDIEERRGEVTLLVRTTPDDMGRLIGRRGRVIQALRQLVRAAGSTEGITANVDVLD